MTDKVIIDGIDVSECKYYHKEYPDDDCAISGHCEAYGDCSYKNLQLRKQFRNLQVQYEKVIKCHKQLQKELREKTVESVRLKAQYDKVVEQNKSLQAELREKTAQCEELKKEYEDILDSRQREWEEEYERYKQALDEIEQICRLLIDNNNLRRLIETILDIIKRTGGQRVKAAAYPFNARRPRQKVKEGK